MLAAAVAFTVVFTLVMRALADRHAPEPEENAAPAMTTDLVPPLLAILG